MEVSGRSVRHSCGTQKNLQKKKEKDLIHLKEWVLKSNFSHEKRILLAKTIASLTLSLRSRYGGLENDADKKFFNTTPANSIFGFGITIERLAGFLKENFGNPEDSNELFHNLSTYLVEICTHRHTTLSRVLSFTASGSQLLKVLLRDSDFNVVKLFMKQAKEYLESQFTKPSSLSEEDKMHLRGIYMPYGPFLHPSILAINSKNPVGQSKSQKPKDLQRSENERLRNSSSLTAQFESSCLKEQSVCIPEIAFLKQEPIDTNKRDHFLKFIQLLQLNPALINWNVKNFFCEYFSLSENNFNIILSYCNPESSVFFSLFSSFLSENTKNFLSTLKYTSTEIDRINLRVQIEFSDLIKEIIENLMERGISLNFLPLHSLDLSKVNFKKFKNEEPLNLSEARLKITQIQDLSLDKVQLTRTFFNTNISIPELEWFSIISSIRAIPSTYANLKMNLMTLLCEKIENHKNSTKILSFVKDLLLIMFFDNDFYIKNKSIRLFAETIFIPYCISNHNSIGKKYLKEEMKSLYENFIFPFVINKESHWFMESFGGFINQFIYSCLIYDDTEVKNWGLLLQKKYICSIPENVINAFNSLDMDSDMMFLGENANYMLFSTSAQKYIALSFDYYKVLVLNEPAKTQISWTYFFVCEKKEQTNEYKFLHPILDHILTIPLFRNHYQKALRENDMLQKLDQLFTQFNFGPYLFHIQKAMGFNFRPAFKDTQKYEGNSLVDSSQAQYDLKLILQELYCSDKERLRHHLIKITNCPIISVEKQLQWEDFPHPEDPPYPKEAPMSTVTYSAFRQAKNAYLSAWEENQEKVKEVEQKLNAYDSGFIYNFYRGPGSKWGAKKEFYSMSLTPKAEALIDSIFLWKERGEERKRPIFLLCLAVIFGRLGSNKFFGNEKDSVGAFRMMAVACMTTVFYTRGLTREEHSHLDFLSGTFHCGDKTISAIASYVAENFPEEYKEFIPLAWREALLF